MKQSSKKELYTLPSDFSEVQEADDNQKSLERQSYVFNQTDVEILNILNEMILDPRLQPLSKIIGLQLLIKYQRYGPTTLDSEALNKLNGVDRSAEYINELIRFGYLMVNHNKGFIHDYFFTGLTDCFTVTDFGENVIDFYDHKRNR